MFNRTLTKQTEATSAHHGTVNMFFSIAVCFLLVTVSSLSAQTTMNNNQNFGCCKILNDYTRGKSFVTKGQVKLETIEITMSGGRAIFQSDHGKKGMARYTFKWEFSRNIGQLKMGEEFSVTLSTHDEAEPKAPRAWGMATGLEGNSSKLVTAELPKRGFQPITGTTHRVYTKGKVQKPHHLHQASAALKLVKAQSPPEHSWFKLYFQVPTAKYHADAVMYEVVYLYKQGAQPLKTAGSDKSIYKDRGRGSTDWNDHHQWALRQKDKAILANDLKLKIEILFGDQRLSYEKLCQVFAQVSVIIPKYITDAGVFNGDKGVLITTPGPHEQWALSQNSRSAVTNNLVNKVGRTVKNLNLEQRARFFADVSVALAQAALL